MSTSASPMANIPHSPSDLRWRNGLRRELPRPPGSLSAQHDRNGNNEPDSSMSSSSHSAHGACPEAHLAVTQSQAQELARAREKIQHLCKIVGDREREICKLRDQLESQTHQREELEEILHLGEIFLAQRALQNTETFERPSQDASNTQSELVNQLLEQAEAYKKTRKIQSENYLRVIVLWAVAKFRLGMERNQNKSLLLQLQSVAGEPQGPEPGLSLDLRGEYRLRWIQWFLEQLEDEDQAAVEVE